VEWVQGDGLASLKDDFVTGLTQRIVKEEKYKPPSVRLIWELEGKNSVVYITSSLPFVRSKLEERFYQGIDLKVKHLRYTYHKLLAKTIRGLVMADVFVQGITDEDVIQTLPDSYCLSKWASKNTLLLELVEYKIPVCSNGAIHTAFSYTMSFTAAMTGKEGCIHLINEVNGRKETEDVVKTAILYIAEGAQGLWERVPLRESLRNTSRRFKEPHLLVKFDV
ncbi:Hypothetical protein POVN_LOCUS183, partial [uncultured virus]